MKSDEIEFEDDRPAQRETNGMATAALILGILSLFLSILTGLPAIICGVIGLSRAKEARTGTGPALAGLLMGILGSVVCPIAAILLGLLLPAVQKVREAAARMDDTNHYKETALSAFNFESTMNAFPPPFYKDQKIENDQLSWRVVLLKYSERANTYDHSFDYTQAWDAPVNQKASNQFVDYYVSKLDPAGTKETRIQGFVGKGTMFDPDVRNGIKFTDVTDGASNTILFAESRTLVPWAAPRDMPYSANAPIPLLGHPSRPQGFIVCMADGSVRFVKHTANQDILRPYITRNDGQVVRALE